MHYNLFRLTFEMRNSNLTLNKLKLEGLNKLDFWKLNL